MGTDGGKASSIYPIKAPKLDTLKELHDDLVNQHGKFLLSLKAFRAMRDNIEYIYTPKQI